jgi:hypothetical protein
MTVHARAAFQYGIDDLVDVALRNAKTNCPARARRFRNVSLFVGVLLGVAVGALVKLREPDNTPLAIAMGAFAAVAFAMIFAALYPKSQRDAIRRNLLELCGPGPFTCTVELHDDHMLWRDDGQHRQSQTLAALERNCARSASKAATGSSSRRPAFPC